MPRRGSELHLKDGRLIFERLLAWSQADPGRLALADSAQQVDYGKFVGLIGTATRRLTEHGVGSGDRVVLASSNSIEQMAAHFAILACGAVAVPVGPVTAERLAFIVDDCAARTVCVDKATMIRCASVNSRHLFIGLSDLMTGTPLNREPMLLDPLATGRRALDDLASLMYTTGSTGAPKGVMLTYRGLGAALSHIIEYVGFDMTDREAVILPLSHSFGLGQAYCTLLTGGLLWVNDGLRPLRTVMNALQQHNITSFATTPSMLRLLLGVYRSVFLRSARSLRRMVVNSEPLPAEQTADLLATFPKLDIIVYYGLTEASRSTFLRPREEAKNRHRSVGKAAPRVEIMIQDVAGRPMPSGEEGEVCIRGPHLAAGYWCRPDEQFAAFREGWLHTGDLGFLDTEGYLIISGRLKDQINVAGLKVSAAAIEKVIRQHPLVEDVVVMGLPDPDGLRGEAVAAAVVARNASLSVRDIAELCARRLESVALPQRIIFVDVIPRAETGKVLKGELRRVFEKRDDDANS